ncbi:MAG: V-type synthase subunit [Candidatus Hydrogenedentes bacterium]|nr:V-type synthase subunit [Candidatus Hydrogenedentota bacterium]
MKKLTILCPAAQSRRLLRTLHGLGTVEITDVFQRDEAVERHLKRPEVSTNDSDQELQKLNLMLGLIDALAPEKKSFVAGLAPVPLVIGREELDEAVQHFDLNAHYETAQELDAAYRRSERAIGEIQNKIKDLGPYRHLPFRVGDLNRTRHVRMLFGRISASGLYALDQIPFLAWERVDDADNPKEAVEVLVAFCAQDAERASSALTANGFVEATLPHVSGTIQERLDELESDGAVLDGEIAEIRAKAADFAQHRRPLSVLKAFWESCRNRDLALARSAHGRWIQVVTGYVREQDLPAFDNALKTHEGATVLIEDPAPDEAVPVHLSLPDAIRPIQMLVNLFGLPHHATFDPSPFIIFTFLLFFGICFSDVAYGTMLIALSLYVAYRTRPYAGIYNFARLLLYAGISTVIFGFLMGSWFGDLYMPQYLGEGNVIHRIMMRTQVIDPLQKPIAVLLAALAIGMVNQFYGIALKMYSAFLRGDKEEALYDGLLWLIILPGFVILVSMMFVPVPRPVSVVGLVLFALGAVGLILTQGRAESNVWARLATGVISLYGIVGSYGLTAFLGDTMSYCRLLALALTTSIVALSFNMMAGLLRPIPYVGIFLFIAVLIIAHVFNFLISVLGAFVHSMRLIFVEFFGRFYQTGAKPFAPLGFDSRTAIMKKG